MSMSGFLLQGLHLRLDANLSDCPLPREDQPPFTITSLNIDCKNISINSPIDAPKDGVEVSTFCEINVL